MSVLDLILNNDQQVQLLWEMRCDCTQDRNRLIGAVYAHEETRHLYPPAMKGRHAATVVTVRRAPESYHSTATAASLKSLTAADATATSH